MKLRPIITILKPHLGRRMIFYFKEIHIMDLKLNKIIYRIWHGEYFLTRFQLNLDLRRP